MILHCFRPLSTEAIFYARCDTHYLLYVYDMIKKDLMAMSTNQCNYVELVFQRSADVCKTVKNYHTPIDILLLVLIKFHFRGMK